MRTFLLIAMVAWTILHVLTRSDTSLIVANVFIAAYAVSRS